MSNWRPSTRFFRRAVKVELHQLVAPPITSIDAGATLTCTVWPLS